MPQLHDSGSRAIQPSDQTHQHDFARIFGIETEYGVSVTDIPEPMDASHVAMTMFQPVVRRARGIPPGVCDRRGDMPLGCVAERSGRRADHAFDGA